MERSYEGDWVCGSCGESFPIRVTVVNDQKAVYASKVKALSDHHCRGNLPAHVMSGDIWCPLDEDIPELPDWNDLTGE